MEPPVSISAHCDRKLTKSRFLTSLFCTGVATTGSSQRLTGDREVQGLHDTESHKPNVDCKTVYRMLRFSFAVV